MDYNKTIFSKKILVSTGIIYILNFLTGGYFAGLFTLYPHEVIHNYNFWRIFSFVLAPGSIEGILLLIFAFFVIAPKLEELIKKEFFILFLMLLILLQGTIHTIAFWEKNAPLSGFEGVSIYIILLYTFLNSGQKIKFWFLPPQSIILVTFVTIVGWLFAKYFDYKYFDRGLLLSGISSFLFGTIMSLLTIIQLRLLRRFLKKKMKPMVEIQKPNERKMVAMSQANHDKGLFDDLMEDAEFYGDIELNEQRLNEILDKIYEKGKDSLSPEEGKFLEDYAKRL